MNNIEKITERIIDDAQREISQLNAETKARCAEIVAQNEKAAQDEYWKLFKKGTNDAALRLERLGSVAQLEAKKRILRSKQEIIATVFDRAVSMFRELPKDEYIAFLARLAVKSSRTGSEEIILSAQDKADCGKEVCEKVNQLLAAEGKSAAIRLSDETRDIDGGLILRDGNVEMNCSLEVLVNEYKNELTGEVVKILFD